MKKQLINYETLLKVTKAMSMSNRPEEVVQLTVDSVKTSLEIKGCALFLIDPKNKALEVAASCGLSAEYLKKGPLSSIRSIGQSLTDGPVAIYDVSDDPRIQYVYSAEQWEFTLEDVNFVQAVAQIAGILIDMCRLYQGQKEFNEVLMEMREARAM